MFKMYKYITKTFLAVLLVFLFAGNVFAASTDLSVRLSQPKSPTNQDTFGITFVSLDILDRPITVRCFKKGPSDGGFSQFGGDIAVSAGGNTGNCDVNSSILNTAGTYQFYATATAGGDVATSTTDTVDFNTSGPGTPSDFSKDKINSCQYKISYKTADDAGKTVKVELYRSDNQTFSADSGTRVDSHSIGSNISDSFTNSIPDCSKSYFYVLRAFDSFGNGSGLVGDASVTITSTSTSTAQTTVTPGQGAIAAGTGGNVISEGTITPTGEQVTPAEEQKPTGGEVKGTSAANIWNQLKELLSNNYVKFGLGLLAVLAVLFLLYKSGKLKKYIK